MDLPVRVDLDQRGVPHWSMTCEVEWLGEQPVRGMVRMYMLDGEDGGAPRYGDRWRWHGTIRADRRPLAERRGVLAVMHADPQRSERISEGTGSRFAAWCHARRADAHDRLGWGLPEDSESVALARAMLLGFRQEIDRTVHDAFLRTGTLHIIALSGMHVGILVFLLGLILKSAGVTRERWIFWVAPLLVCYTVGTGAAPSMVRSTIMAVVFFSAYLFRRKPDALSALAGAALLILAVDPMQLFDAGFVLSFVSVGGLVSLYPMIVGWLDRMMAGDPWEVDDPSSHRWWRSVKEGITAAFSVSLAAWLATLPLIIGLSNILSPVSLVVNLFMGPASFLLLLTECLAALSGFFSYQLAVTFNHAHDVFASVLLGGILWTARLPGGCWYVATWPLALVALWYLMVIMAAVGQRWRRGVAVACLSAMVIGSMGWRSWSDTIELVSVPAGEGEVVVLDGPGDQVVVFDAGPYYQHRRVIRALRARGIHRIDAVWITRANSEAYGGLTALIDAMDVRAIRHPQPVIRQSTFETHRQRWAERMGSDRVQPWSTNACIAEAGDLLVERLWPQGIPVYRSAGQSTLIIRASRGHHAVVVAGKLDASLEQVLLECPVDWAATGLVVGGCNSDQACGEPWLDAVEPAWIRINLESFRRQPWGDRPIRDRIASKSAMQLIENEGDPFVWRF
ncbi:MAG TPA: ComEC/Rec2 family competence protein [Kiritimatiellia bacterium]|nr:ComEC/Rec2 family competence protein [Kiritimatiellia bacterium]